MNLGVGTLGPARRRLFIRGTYKKAAILILNTEPFMNLVSSRSAHKRFFVSSTTGTYNEAPVLNLFPGERLPVVSLPEEQEGQLHSDDIQRFFNAWSCIDSMNMYIQAYKDGSKTERCAVVAAVKKTVVVGKCAELTSRLSPDVDTLLASTESLVKLFLSHPRRDDSAFGEVLDALYRELPATSAAHSPGGGALMAACLLLAPSATPRANCDVQSLLTTDLLVQNFGGLLACNQSFQSLFRVRYYSSEHLAEREEAMLQTIPENIVALSKVMLRSAHNFKLHSC